jgi:protein tyrosine phosphatase
VNISSAGIGRTGVFIALYYLLEAFERRQMLNVKQLVDTIRLYRPHFVQTVVYIIYIFFSLRDI